MTVILAVGGHLLLLQIAAWSGMMLRHSHNGTVAEALVRTFDGRHPCGLCRLVEKGNRDNQQPHRVPSAESKLVMIAEEAVPIVVLRLPSAEMPVLEFVHGGLVPPRPPLPPPRGVV